jgi:hypothetical protein
MKYRFTWDEEVIETRTIVVEAKTEKEARSKFVKSNNRGDALNVVEIRDVFNVRIEKERKQ